MEKDEKKHQLGDRECTAMILHVKDALDVLGGKWKLQVIVALSYGARRFKEISREVGGITDRMLSKELRDLEFHQLVKRTVHDAFPPIVDYQLTDHGRTLHGLIEELGNWGVLHRKKVLEE